MSRGDRTSRRPRRSGDTALVRHEPPAPLPAPAHRTPRDLVALVVDTPALARAVPQLPPELLSRVIDRCGLETSAGLLALTTPGQLAAVLDLELWHAPAAGADEQFDPARFSEWLAAMLEHDPRVAVRQLAALDHTVVVQAFSHYVRVFDAGSAASYETLDGEWFDGHADASAVATQIGGFHVVARQADEWDVMTLALMMLAEEQPRAFRRVMRGCRALSYGAREVDGLDDLLEPGAQAGFDTAVGRERRRDRQGYVPPAQARAFLQSARSVRLDAPGPPVSDPVAAACLRELAGLAREERATAASLPPSDATAEEQAASLGALVTLLRDAGLEPPAPAGLLSGGTGRSDGTGAPGEGTLADHLRALALDNPQAAFERNQELAFLGNALVSGGSLQGRAFTPREASEAALATCRLGLARWPSRWEAAPHLESKEGASANPLSSRSLIVLFQVGWTTLYREISVVVADRLLEALHGFACSDPETERGLDELRRDLVRQRENGTPWRCHDSLDVLAVFDLPAWAALVALFGECPVLLANVSARGPARPLTVSPNVFGFVSEPAQIADVHRFMRELPDALVG